MEPNELEDARSRRWELANKFAAEVATWSAAKLRACYAQPEAVREAELREQRLWDNIRES